MTDEELPLPPEVECVDCERRVRCIRVKDGTVYRPLAWKFPDPSFPLNGFCGDCQIVYLATL